jgi:cytochrome c-type biogenesis protein CcmH
MIWFLVAAGLLSVAALALLLAPMTRSRGGLDVEEPVAALFRRQLAALDEELAEGRLTPDEAEASRAEITRRLLAAADSENAAAAEGTARHGPEMTWRFGAAVAIAGLLPATALAIYFAVGSPAAIQQSASGNTDGSHNETDLAAAADQIKAHLQKAPNDLKGWTLLGRTLASLGRFGDARDAYGHAVALAPGNAALHAEFGEVLVLAAQGAVTPAAAAEFAKDPDDPRSRYYAAEAALQQGDPAAAKAKLQALLAAAPPEAPWRQAVADRLAELSQSGGAAPTGATPGGPAPASSGPSAQEVAAAQAMTPDQRQAMIRGMVDRLAQRLEQHPDDKAGWDRLARAYDVLGQSEKARAARARAAAAGDAATAALTPATGPASAPAAPQAAGTAASAAPGDAQAWIERAHDLQGQGRTADALAALKQGNQDFPGDLPLLEAYLNALAGSLKDDKPTPEFVAVAAQIHALDPGQRDALWYLGLAAAQNGDGFRAASYWTKLVSELPSSDPQRALVQHQLDALR